MKTLLYIGGFEFPDKNAAAHRAINLAKAFRELDYRVVFVGVYKSKETKTLHETKEIIQGFETYSIKYPSTFQEWVNFVTDSTPYLTLAEDLSNLAGIMMADFPAFAMMSIQRYCKKNKIWSIAECTEWFQPKFSFSLFYIVKSFDVWLRMRVLQKNCDLVIAISKALHKYYRRHTETIYIPVLVDVEEEKWKTLPTIQKKSETIELVYAGSPGDKDNLSVFLDSLKFVKRKYHVTIIGITADDFSSKYGKTIDKYVSPNVDFKGRISHIETLNYVNSAHYSCFFRPINRVSENGFPTKFAEAITCGTPVLTNRTSNLEDYSKKNRNCVIIDSLAPKNIGETIDKLTLDLATESKVFDYRAYIALLKECLDNIDSNCKIKG